MIPQSVSACFSSLVIELADMTHCIRNENLARSQVFETRASQGYIWSISGRPGILLSFWPSTSSEYMLSNNWGPLRCSTNASCKSHRYRGVTYVHVGVMYVWVSCTRACHVHVGVIYTWVSCTYGCHIHMGIMYMYIDVMYTCVMHRSVSHAIAMCQSVL